MGKKDIYTSYLKAAAKIARQAGDFLLTGLNQAKKVDFKGEVDLVTAFDRQSEEMIFNELNELFPGLNFLAEESIRRDNHSDLGWIVDPLDGTTNFSHGLPVFCVSIALASKGEVVAGVVYDPNRAELFSAIKGGGTFLNDRPVRVSSTGELDKSLLATGFPYDIRESKENNLDYFNAMAVKVQAIRRAGAAALDLAYLAAGRFDGFWELKLKPWDTAAASLMVEEAGGVISDITGDKWHLQSPAILASNGLIHEQMIRILQDV